MIVMRLIFILFTLWCLPGLAQQIAVPELRQQVTDITGTLSTSEQQSLTQQLQDITHKTRAQVAVLVVPSIGDDSIEQYATRVFDNWRLGDAKRNDGILIIVAWSDRTVRIQVGYGLEEKVTDALAGNIIRSIMIPASNPSESESASSSDHYYFAIFWVFAVMFFPFWFFHQGNNFCRAFKSSVCISTVYLIDLFLFSDQTFSIAVFSFFFAFTIIMVFTWLCVPQKKASGRSYHSDSGGSGGGSSGGGFSGGGGSSGGGGASGRW